MSKSKHTRQNKAVALRYRSGEDAAPLVIASGYGQVAQRIVDVAEQKGIPVFRDDSTASVMCMLDVGRTIPPELYQVVAAIYCKILEISDEIRHNESLSATEQTQPREAAAQPERIQIVDRDRDR